MAEDEENLDEDAGEIEEVFEDTLICRTCGGMLEKETVPITETENSEKFLIQNVPALVCQECGEIWLSPEVIRDIENTLKETLKKHKDKKEKGPHPADQEGKKNESVN